MNSYSVSLQLLTNTHDAASTNIAMERLKCFVYYELGNAVFINQNQNEKAEMLQMLGANIVTLPEDPIDQIIGIMLYVKLNSIMENRMSVTKLDISSVIGDSVWYQHDEEESLGPFSQDGWWHRNSIQKETLDLDPTPENVVKVESTGWKEYGLEWPEETKERNANVVFPKFKRDENEQTR